jgi:hypothetical protein
VSELQPDFGVTPPELAALRHQETKETRHVEIREGETVKTKTLMLIGVALSFVMSAAFGAAVHFKGGKNAGPSFYDLGLYLGASGVVAGLGNEDGVVLLTARGIPEATCQNPGNGVHYPPGQNPAPYTLTGSLPFSPDDFDKNGNYAFYLETDEPESPIPGAPDCPNPKWTEEIVDIAFTSADLVIMQGGAVVLEAFCTFSPPTSDGKVKSSDCIINDKL